MARVAIMVEFTVNPGARDALDAILRRHATMTLAEEPGCERFEVLQPLGPGGRDETRLIVWEVYRDAAAFDAHGRNPRLSTVRESYAGLIGDRRLVVCEL